MTSGNKTLPAGFNPSVDVTGTTASGVSTTLSTTATVDSPDVTLRNQTGSATITVVPPPVANGQSVIDGENKAKAITLTRAAPNGDSITYAVTVNPTHGTLSGTAPNLTYTPNTNYTGGDSFQFTVTDTTTGFTSAAATVTITVVAAPVANNQSVTVQQNTPTGVTLTGSDPNGDPITYAVTANPTHGALSGTTPNLTYTPSSNYTGADSFQFTITDTATGLVQHTATVSVTVTPPAVAFIYDWNGSQSTDWFNAAELDRRQQRRGTTPSPASTTPPSSSAAPSPLPWGPTPRSATFRSPAVSSPSTPS